MSIFFAFTDMSYCVFAPIKMSGRKDERLGRLGLGLPPQRVFVFVCLCLRFCVCVFAPIKMSGREDERDTAWDFLLHAKASFRKF